MVFPTNIFGSDYVVIEIWNENYYKYIEVDVEVLYSL